MTRTDRLNGKAAAVGAVLLLVYIRCRSFGLFAVGSRRRRDPVRRRRHVFVVPESDAAVTDEGNDLRSYCPSDRCPPGHTTCPNSRFLCDIDLLTDPTTAESAATPAGARPSGPTKTYACVDGRCVMTCQVNKRARLRRRPRQRVRDIPAQQRPLRRLREQVPGGQALHQPRDRGLRLRVSTGRALLPEPVLPVPSVRGPGERRRALRRLQQRLPARRRRQRDASAEHVFRLPREPVRNAEVQTRLRRLRQPSAPTGARCPSSTTTTAARAGTSARTGSGAPSAGPGCRSACARRARPSAAPASERRASGTAPT